MAEIRAFRGSRFTGEAGELAELLAPAAETIGAEERERWAREPNNAVHATLPAGESDDRSRYVRYARASAQLSGWRRAGLLVVDAAPAMYRVLSGEGEAIHAALLALVRLADLPPENEAVPVKLRDDRLRLLEATRAHLEPVPVRADVPDLDAALLAAPVAELGRAASPDGTPLAFAAIVDADAQVAFAALLEGAELHPAAGFAMVEAARAFRAARGERAAPVAEDLLLAAISTTGRAIPSGLAMWSLGEFA